MKIYIIRFFSILALLFCLQFLASYFKIPQWIIIDIVFITGYLLSGVMDIVQYRIEKKAFIVKLEESRRDFE